MDAKLKKIQVVPATIDADGEITRDEFAALTFEVPLDSITAKKEVMALFSYLTTEFVKVEVSSDQLPIEEVKTQEVSLSQSDVRSQLKTLKGEN